MSTILIVAEQKEGALRGATLNAIDFARKLAAERSADIAAVVIGDSVGSAAEELAKYVPRVLAAVMTTPMLAVFANLCGLIGGAVVFLSFGHPLVSYYRQVQGAVTHVDLLGGIFKAFTFGVIVAAVGCARGLQTGHGASAVGLSTTRSVVSGILLIVIADMAFALLYYALDI